MNKFINYSLRIILFLFIVYFGYQIYTGPRGVKDWLKARKERVKVSLQYDTVLLEKNRLQEELLAFKNDPRFLEGEVRKNLKKGKKGEVFYIFQDEKLAFADDKHIKK